MSTKNSRKRESTMTNNDARKREIAVLRVVVKRLEEDLTSLVEITGYLLDVCPGVPKKRKKKR